MSVCTIFGEKNVYHVPMKKANSKKKEHGAHPRRFTIQHILCWQVSFLDLYPSTTLIFFCFGIPPTVFSYWALGVHTNADKSMKTND